MSNIGMMEGAFFVGRKEILDWINNTLDLNLGKIEDTASGAVACLLLDIMYPSQVPVAKINWAAKQDFEFVANYKILQTCFTKLAIDKHIDVDRLISGKYMDNLEFMQWFKRFFEMAIPEKVSDYDAYGQRCKGKGGASYAFGKKAGASARSAPARQTSMARPPTGATKPKTAPEATKSAGQENSAPNLARTASVRTEKPAASVAAGVKPVPRTVGSGDETQRQLDESRKQCADLKVELEGLEKERDFYFDKLRDIEMLLQDEEDNGHGSELTAAILKILYATADGFEAAPVEEAASSPVESSAKTLTLDPVDDLDVPGATAVTVGDETF